MIENSKEIYNVSLMCKVLDIPRSTYYYFKTKKPSKRSLENANLEKEIKSIYDDSKGIYGAPKIHKILSKKLTISLKRVQRLMKKTNLRSVILKKYKPYSKKVKIEERTNILKRDFSTKDINEKWTGDITYIHTIKDGWCYLASVMDLHTRKIIGYSFGKKMTTDLAIKSLENAYTLQQPNKNVVFHSDLGSQYTSLEFINYAKNKGIVQSFSKKGCPYDNASIESFHATLKKEEVYRFKYFDYNIARVKLFEYIEGWYNRKRIHGSINFMTPNECEILARVN